MLNLKLITFKSRSTYLNLTGTVIRASFSA